jgi:FMN phosphatase YigB (HAD superfamily)
MDAVEFRSRFAGGGFALAARCSVAFAAIVTAEEAGFYKPRPEPYRAVLARLGTAAERTLFVAGSAADVPGAMGLGMPVYWHNRMGLAPVGDAMPDYVERSLTPLLEIV